MPEDAEYILKRTRNVHGFYGASSMERCSIFTTNQAKAHFLTLSVGYRRRSRSRSR